MPAPAAVSANASAFGVLVRWEPPQDGWTADSAVLEKSVDGGATWTELATLPAVVGGTGQFADTSGLPPSGSAQYRVHFVAGGMAGQTSAGAVATRASQSIVVTGPVRSGSMNADSRHPAYFLPDAVKGPWSAAPDGASMVVRTDDGTGTLPYNLRVLPTLGSTTMGTVVASSAMPYTSLSWSPDGARLAWRTYDRSVSRETLFLGSTRAGTTPTDTGISDFHERAWLPDSRTLVGVHLGRAAFYDTETRTFRDTPLAATDVALSPDARHILVETNDSNLTRTYHDVYSFDPNTLLLTDGVRTDKPYETFLRPSFSPDGSRLLARGRYSMVEAPVSPEGTVGATVALAPDEGDLPDAMWIGFRPTLTPVRSAAGVVKSLTIGSARMAAGTAYTCALDAGPATACAGSWAPPATLEGGRHTLFVTAREPSGRVAYATSTWATQTGGFTSVAPKRVLDTRTGTGAPKRQLGPGGTVTLTVPGLPADATAVALNVTATRPSTATFLTLYPADRARPGTSSVNAAAGQTIANLVTVGVAPGGTVKVTNAKGAVDVVADLAGYYSSSKGSRYTGIAPQRILDTRNGIGSSLGPIGPADERGLVWHSSLPSRPTALSLTVTATAPTTGGYFTVYPNTPTPPTASNVNFTAGQTVANHVEAALDLAGVSTLLNAKGYAHAVADVSGYFSSDGAALTSITPRRVLDTRFGIGAPRARVPKGGAVVLSLPGLPPGASAAIVNLTAVAPDRAGYLTAYPTGQARPATSNVNFANGQTIASSTTVTLGTDGRAVIASPVAGVDMVVDLVGFYAF